ncbi:helix-turn-helix domain-containing protein [Vreelandella alkaliphila]|uniref:helix-turn-helix domain-containing protein n=1 Tax=Vreelandella alkaliphila TaxID=272774 RepID=UPI001FEC41B1|nr:helix-turn-helix transcriptional regulator [Halomonas humidisoli]
MINLKALKEQALQTPEVKAEYDRLAPEFELATTLISMRQRAGLTQEELAKRLHTQKSNISRLERGDSNPGWKTLQRYADACGFELSVQAQRHKTAI